MIIFFSFLTNHEYVIKQEGPTHRGRFHYLHILEFRFFVMKHLWKRNPEFRKHSFFVDPVVGHQQLVCNLFLPLFGIYKLVPCFLEFFLTGQEAVGHPSRYKPCSMVQALELILENVHALPWLHFGGTCEYINSSIFELWPGVDCHVRFCNDDNSTNPIGLKMVEIWRNDCGVAQGSTVKEILLDILGRV